MSVFFFDSSALAKRYLTETGSVWIASVTNLQAGHAIVVADVTRVEVAAALSTRHRASGGITLAERDRLFRLLALHCVQEYRIVPITDTIVDQGMVLTQSYRLRGYDAIQLAVGLAAAIQPGLVFVAADDDLLAAGRSEGLAVDNPNLH